MCCCRGHGEIMYFIIYVSGLDVAPISVMLLIYQHVNSILMM